jgi:hypothetical protein
MSRLCSIPTCGQHITSDHSDVHEKGLDGLIRASIARDDGFHHILENKRSQLPLSVHGKCRREYIRAHSIDSHKRQREDAMNSDGGASSAKLRSMTPVFNIKTDCVYCTREILHYSTGSKVPHDRRVRSHNAMTKVALQSIIAKANDRGDEWGYSVKLRLSAEIDAIAAEVKYHHDCQVSFYDGRPCPNEDNKQDMRRGRPVDLTKQAAFDKLCQYIRDNDECQYTLQELASLMDVYLDGAKGYDPKRLGQKLEESFQKDIVCTCDIGKPTIYTFLDTSNRIIRDKYESSSMTKESIIDIAAALIQDDIRSASYVNSEYPVMSKLQDSPNMVPDSLKRLLSRIITTKSDNVLVCERRRTAIAHSIISACRPRSFVSPILLAISVYINRKYESRELVDILSSLSFADDYTEIQRLYSAMLSDEQLYDLKGDITNFIFDNADINVRTLTGHGTWHVMGGLACVTPTGDEAVEPTIPRSTQRVDRCIVPKGQFGHVQIKVYKKPKIAGFKSITIGPLEPPKTNLEIFRLSTCLDSVWLASFSLGIPVSSCPSWSGFMQCAVRGENHEKSRIHILPFVNQDPSQPDTIYSALCFAQKLSEKYELGVCPVTFDQPLYIKAAEIVKSSDPELKRIVVRLGGFHVLMSLMGSIGYVMGGSGQADLWETVYAPNTVIHMMTGHAYARALRAHLLTSQAITSLLLQTPGCLTGVNRTRLQTIHNTLLNGKCSTECVQNEACVKQLTQIIHDLMKDVAIQSRTGKLWVEYLKQVSVIRCFLRAERTGDWDLHLHTISDMIPLFHSAGHLAYAKSARLYLDQMKNLPDMMSETQYNDFTKKGYFTIRRTDKFWSGNFSDQTIEQDLMRLLKTSGGMARGRGITDSTLAKWVHAIPRCIPICDALEIFTGVRSHTSEQHVDLRASNTARDSKDYETLLHWLKLHSPFSYGEHKALVCVASGVVAGKCVNAEEAFALGVKSASAIPGKKPYGEVTLKRKDRITSISGDKNQITVRGVEVEVNSTLLFMRVTCVIKDASQMEGYLLHEFAKQPPSLFDKGIMRKNTKSALANVLKSKVNVHFQLPDRARFIIDGGHLLQSLPWPADATYNQICDNYVSYVTDNYGFQAVVVFDGYGSASSTKSAEQLRRAQQQTFVDILFELAMKTTTSKHAFFSNAKNKDRLIKKLMEKFESKGLTVKQSNADADWLIVSVAMDVAQTANAPVVVVANDTDLLVMMVGQATSSMDLHMLFGRNPLNLYSIGEIQTAFHSVKQHLMFIHAITGCDTVSALYNQGKKKALALFGGDDNWNCLDVFTGADSSHEDIARVGEVFLLQLYGARQVKSLDKYRYMMYFRSVNRTSISSSGFKLESLPPTSRQIS